MGSALLAMALSVTDVATAKMDARTPERVLVAELTSPFETDVVWHESELVFIDDGVASLALRIEDAYAPLGHTPIRLRDGFSRRAVETIHARF